jgi:hypothetical protein
MRHTSREPKRTDARDAQRMLDQPCKRCGHVNIEISA